MLARGTGALRFPAAGAPAAGFEQFFAGSGREMAGRDFACFGEIGRGVSQAPNGRVPADDGG
jgi:hypothetical protein